MKRLIIGFALSTFLFASMNGSAAEAVKKKGHGAHEHGHAKLNIVVEGNKLTAQLEAPSESIYGFEYMAKTDADIKKRDAGGETLKSNFEKMLVIEQSFGCVFKNLKLDLHVPEDEESRSAKTKKGEHSETHAEFVANCAKPLAGAKVSFAFGKYFARIKEVKVQVVSGEKQSGADIDNDKGTVTL